MQILRALQFQSTRPRGARHAVDGPQRLVGDVSILAPTRGATCRSCRGPRRPRSFNPRAHAGRDIICCCVIIILFLFQSTRPRGARRQKQLLYDKLLLVSIHAPTRGATEKAKAETQNIEVSIHAPTRGATLMAARNTLLFSFQSTRPRGARRVLISFSEEQL